MAGKKGVTQHRLTKGKVLKIAGASEVQVPKTDKLNIWDHEFGYVLKDGRPTETTKAYWQAQRRKLKQ